MRAFITVIFCVLGIAVVAQEYAVKQFTVDDGLPSSHVYEVKQDKQGFYWICTNEGLAKYDGYSFQLITSKDESFSDDIWWTYQDLYDNIWTLSTGTNLWYLKDDSFKTRSVHFKQLPEDICFGQIAQDTSDWYWLIIGSRIFSFKDETYNSYNGRDLGLVNIAGYVSIHYSNTDGVFFVAMGPLSVWNTNPNGELYKVYKYARIIWSGSDMPEGPDSYNEANTTVVVKNRDTLYTIHENRLEGYFKGKYFDLGLFPASHMVKSSTYKVLKVGDKYAFINSSGNFMTDSQFTHLPEYDFMESYNINTVYEDHEGSFWISTTDQGLFYITQDALASKSYAGIDGLNAEVIGIETDDNGVKWIAFKNGNIISYYNGNLTTYSAMPSNDKDKNWFLRDIKVVDKYLILTVGNYDIQIFEINRSSVEIDNPIRIYEVDNTKAVNLGVDGNLYIADYIKTYKLSLDKELPEKLPEDTYQKVLSVTANKKGELIASTFGGVHRSNGKETKLLSYDLHTKKFEVDPDKNLWLVLKGRGAYRIINDTLQAVKPLENILIEDIYFEADTTLWVASNEGLIKFDRDKESDEYRYNRKLTLAHGLLTNEVTAVSSNSRYLYVGTTKGFNIIDKTKLTNASEGYEILLTKISSKGENLNIADNYSLLPNQNALDLSYVYISPKSAGQITYQYMLKGIDTEWKETRETSISYSFLPAGDYKFILKARDINGTLSSEPVELNITVQEYWWKTNWFRLVLAITFIVTVVIIFRIRIKQLEKREKERTELNNRIAELKLKALQSQMDPHFVFNVLNSIQEFFISNNVEAANRYLSDFSKLMRLFLNASDEKYIALDKEVKLLTLYIELEKMRINNKFEYEFIATDDTELDELYVPSMLIQPLIENAIKHGLRHKEKDGKLLIEIEEKENGDLLIVVEDNGIGREKSKEINSRVRKDHKSKASGIIAERIEIINSSTEGTIHLKYIDLKNVEMEACGTRAELILNLKVNKKHVHGADT